MHVTRRSFLSSAAMAGAGLMLGASPARARVPLTRSEERVVIIGSGFGGGVTALRLAQAGVPSLVLERGRRWVTGPNADTFPSPLNPDERLLWYGSAPELFGRRVSLAPYAGLIDSVVGDNMTALCAAGVGGGSLLYQGMTLQPAKHVFEAHLPAGLDYDEMDRVFYPRVAQMLQVETAPDELVDSPNYRVCRVFRDRVAAAGYQVEKVPMPIDWDYALAELRGEMKPSYTDASGCLGVNNGGKHTIDVTYLAQAEATGRTTVAPLHHVMDIARAADGRWTIDVERTDEHGTVLEHKQITAGTLVMAAGSLGTTKLLMRAQGRGLITDLPDGLGEGWGTNGDRIYTWTSPTDTFGATQGGPVVFDSKEWDDPERANTIIQASIPPLGLDTHTSILVGYGTSRARGSWRYDPLSGQAQLHFPKEGDLPVQARIFERLTKIVAPLGVLVDTNLVLPSTWHGLGGANMGTVCDTEGRVLDQPGLYVLDGALIPGSTAACNPSMTIAAVAERALDRIVRTDVGTLI